MAIETKHLTSLIELLYRRDAPQGADLQRGLHLARIFEADLSVPLACRSLAWHVITESHMAAGWPMPKGERFPACCGAAASTKYGCAMLIQDIAEQAAMIDGPVLLLGALAASRSVFGDWNTLPAKGAYLVPLEGSAGNHPPSNVYHGSLGVKWGAPGDIREILAEHSMLTELAGTEVLIPAPDLITARTAGCPTRPEDIECLIFIAAAHAATKENTWDNAVRIAPQLGQKNAPLKTAMRLRIDSWLRIPIPKRLRAIRALKRLLSPVRAA